MRENTRALAETRRLFELTDLLIQERPISEVLEAIAEAFVAMRGVDSAAVLLPDGDGLCLAASAGQSLSAGEIEALVSDFGQPIAVGLASASSSPIRVLSLVAAGRPLGMLVLRGVPHSAVGREALTTLASQVSLAVERAQLRIEALRSESLQRTNELRRSLLATTAHDLRGPLATMKVATSTLCESLSPASAADHGELCQLLDARVDHMVELHHIRLPVADPWASRDWYSRVFGFTPVLDLEEENEVVGVVLRHESGLTLGLRLDDARARALQGFAVLGLSVSDSDGLAEWTRRLDHLAVKHGALEEGHLGTYVDVPDVRRHRRSGLHTGSAPDAGEA